MSDDQRGARPTLPWAGTLETGEAADVGARQRSTIDLLDARAAVDDAPVGVGQIGRFIVLRRIGVGGMGVVYLAYDNALDRRVAIKVLRGLGPPAPERRARFAREAQAMARLSHPNVVQIYEAGESDGALFLAMEYVRGGSLRTWLLGQDAKDERGATATRGWREIVAMFAQAGRGLAAAHEAGLVHRDFKPDNVLVDGDDVARVGDFGLARLLEEAPAEAPAGPAPALHSLTATRAVMGTPAYMSPEQHAGRPADARTDQFSFCVALWEALYGARPFAGETLAALAAAITRGPALAPEREGRAPTWLKATLVRGLAGDPVDRWPSMDALLSALLDDPQARRRRWVIAGGLVLGVGALVGALASSSLEGRRQAEVATRRAEVASAERDVALETAEQAATRARDALRMSALREVEVDSTSAALVLAEVEAPARAPGWTEAALALRQEPIAQVVLRGHGNWIVGALFIGDGEEWVVTSSYDATARVWRADGRGGAQVLWHAGLVELLPGADRRSFITNDKRVARLWSLTDRPGEPVELVREFAADDGAELVALTPDGARLFTISAEGVGRLWEVATGRALVVYGADGGAQPVAVAYDPAGRWITGDVHGRLRSWSVDDERHGAVPTPGGALINLHVGVHGQIIAAYEQEAIAWSSSGERRFVASGHESGLFDAVINPAGDEFATAGHDGVVRLWGVERGELRAALEHTSTLSGVTYSPDGRWIGVNTYDSTLLWSRASPHELHELRGRIGQGAGMVMDQAGARVLTFADDNTARLWTLTTTPTMLFRLRALEEAFGGCELGRVVAVSSAGTLRAWACDASTPPIEQALGGQAFFFAPDPTLRLAAYTNSEGVWVRPLAGGAARRLGTHEPLPWGLAWSPDGRWLLTTGYDSVARIWDVTGDAPPIVLAGHTAPVVWGGAFSPDGQAVATIGNDASVRIWSVGHVLEAPRAGEVTIAAAQVHAGHVRGAKQVRWSPDGSRVLTCSPDATARIWDPTGAVAPVVLEGHRGEVSAAEWSPDGRMVATASEDGTARLWSLDAVDAPRVLRGHRDAVASIDWHPDGGAVVTASADGTVRVWTVADGATVDVLNLRAEVLAAEFVDGGARVRIAGDDALRLWRPQLDGRPEPDALMGRLRASTTACLTVRERELILLESLEEARARHAACEARFGRAPDEREGVAQRPPAPAG